LFGGFHFYPGIGVRYPGRFHFDHWSG
jgi:hypothetical protein